MSPLKKTLPLALYIHFPWCVKKCPYCDFNSHTLKKDLPEPIYIERLLQDLEQDLSRVSSSEIISIFMGGGTPSLFSPDSLANLLERIQQRLKFAKDIEITLEANPGTVEQARFQGYRQAGINRISLGIQSFQEIKLKTLGRIHNHHEAIKAVEAAQAAGFTNINLDLMFGLPQQSIEDGLADLKTAVKLNPTHISWYQLTLEPNTLFFHKPPPLPDDHLTWQMQTEGQEFLRQAGFHQYEISAYSRDNLQCKHNLNYWLFGDYLGIGAGAHGKLTVTDKIIRTWKVKHPQDYLDHTKAFLGGEKILEPQDIPFEFMLNALRLYQPISHDLFFERTGLTFAAIENSLKKAQQLELIQLQAKSFSTTSFGKRYLNDLLELFLTA